MWFYADVVGRGGLRRSLVCVCAFGAMLIVSGWASAGYGAYPTGQTLEVTVSTTTGSIEEPTALDFVVGLDSQDSNPSVWVSDSPAVDSYGLPAGRTLGACLSNDLIPFGEPGKWVCRESTILLRAGQTYYWWLKFSRREPNEPYATSRVSGPFPFTLVARTQPPPPPPEESEEEPEYEGPLLDTRKVNARRAFAVVTVIHESLHAYGVLNEAEANCYAVQYVRYFGRGMGLTQTRADYLEKLALNFTRRTAPRRYWNHLKCREGGAWDIFSGRNLS